MTEYLPFFKNYEVLIYLLLGIVAVWQARKFTLALDELRAAAFGLEIESARNRVIWSASMLILIFLLAVAEFSLVTFVAPAIPEVNPLPTATLDLLATPTTTLPPSVATALPQSQPEGGQTSCIPGQVEITSPQDNETVRDVVEITGSANTPNFGFYKFEIAAAGSENWLTIQAGDTPVQDDVLGYWDTTLMAAGDYTLRLVVTDNQGESAPPCIIRVRVEAPSE
ncbi:MAG: hypothetical protein D6803_06535 [Anaerolineae bacterium]|nr:MAG: hypothetical protein D6803_06535 [Anaerolineae bacterium]